MKNISNDDLLKAIREKDGKHKNALKDAEVLVKHIVENRISAMLEDIKDVADDVSLSADGFVLLMIRELSFVAGTLSDSVIRVNAERDEENNKKIAKLIKDKKIDFKARIEEQK